MKNMSKNIIATALIVALIFSTIPSSLIYADSNKTSVSTSKSAISATDTDDTKSGTVDDSIQDRQDNTDNFESENPNSTNQDSSADSQDNSANEQETFAKPKADNENNLAGKSPANLNKSKSRQPRAATDTYINLPMLEGEHPVSGVINAADWMSTNSNVATFESGKILAHGEGTAVVTVDNSSVNKQTFYVSSYYSYPQPKKSLVFDSVNSRKLSKFGTATSNAGDTAGTATVHGGDKLTVLYRVMGDGADSMQYVETAGGNRGYLSNQDNSDRAMATYQEDVAIGESDYLYTTLNGNIREDSGSWVSSAPNTVSVTQVDRPSGDNQGKITAEKEGTATVTTTIAGNANRKSSTFVTAYTSLSSNVQGRTIKSAYVRRAASANRPVMSRLALNANVTISGECGNYWRIGNNQYVLKSSVYIPATSISLNRSSMTLYNTGNARTLTLTDTVRPRRNGDVLAQGTVTWTSSNPSVAIVSQSGRVTGVSGGTATITATIDDKVARCNVTVCVPITALGLPQTLAVPTNKTYTVSPAVTPSNNYGNAVNWKSINSGAGISKYTGSHDGKLVTTTTQLVTELMITADPPKPTVGTQAQTKSASTVLSVYKPTSGYYVTNKKKASKYLAATKPTGKKYPQLIRKNFNVKTRGTLLKAIGKSGDYYYVTSTNNPNTRWFMHEDDLTKVNMKHKTIILGQTYTPKSKGKVPLFRKGKKITIKSVYGSSVKVNKNTGALRAVRKGVTHIRRTKLTRSGKSITSIYEYHVTAPEMTNKKIGYLTEAAHAYHCGGGGTHKCFHKILTKGKRVTITAKVNGLVRATYALKSGKTQSRYIPESLISYIDLEPVVLEKGSGAGTFSVKFNHFDMIAEEAYLNSVNITGGLISADINGGNRQQIILNDIDSKPHGYTLLTIYAGNNSRFKTTVPVSVYRKLAGGQKTAYTNRTCTVFAGSNTASFKRRILSKDTDVRIIGMSGKFYYVDTGKEKGFILAANLSYADLITPHKTFAARTSDSIKIRVYNNSNISDLKIACGGGNVVRQTSVRRTDTSRADYGETVYTYTVNLRAYSTSGRINMKVKSRGKLIDHCYISTYEPSSVTEGFTNQSAYMYRIANTGIHPIMGNLSKLRKVRIIGFCKDSWAYVSIDGYSFWVPVNVISYIKFDKYPKTIYVYQNQTISSDLVRYENKSKDITYRTDGGEINFVSKKNNKYTFAPTESGKLKITARYMYASGQSIETHITINVKNIVFEIVNDFDRITEGKTQNFKIRIIRGPKQLQVKWSSSDNKRLSFYKNSDKAKALKYGYVEVNAKYHGIEATKKKPLYVISKTGITNGNPPSSVVKAFNFHWDNKQGIWYVPWKNPGSTKKTWQYYFGYNRLMDIGFEVIAEIIDKLTKGKKRNYISHKKFQCYFRADNSKKKEKVWMVEGWKGNYANLGVGAEIGLYYRNLTQKELADENETYVDIDDSFLRHYDSVADSDTAIMHYKLHKNKMSGFPLFTRGPERHFWLVGFRPGIKPIDKEKLVASGYINFNNSKVAQAFCYAENIAPKSRSDISRKQASNSYKVIIKEWK